MDKSPAQGEDMFDDSDSDSGAGDDSDDEFAGLGDEDDEDASSSDEEEEALLPIEKKARKEDARLAKEKADTQRSSSRRTSRTTTRTSWRIRTPTRTRSRTSRRRRGAFRRWCAFWATSRLGASPGGAAEYGPAHQRPRDVLRVQHLPRSVLHRDLQRRGDDGAPGGERDAAPRDPSHEHAQVPPEGARGEPHQPRREPGPHREVVQGGPALYDSRVPIGATPEYMAGSTCSSPLRRSCPAWLSRRRTASASGRRRRARGGRRPTSPRS